MPLKDRFRNAIHRPSTSNSSFSEPNANPPSTPPTIPTDGTSTPTPSITLTKTNSKLGLNKVLTWKSQKNDESTSKKTSRKESKARKKLEEWSKKDEEEWDAGVTNRPGRLSKAHQDLLRKFEFNVRPSLDGEKRRRFSGRSWGSVSGVSPGTSRVGSVDVEGDRKPRKSTGGGRKWSGGGLSREVSRDDSGGTGVETVAEE